MGNTLFLETPRMEKIAKTGGSSYKLVYSVKILVSTGNRLFVETKKEGGS